MNRPLIGLEGDRPYVRHIDGRFRSALRPPVHRPHPQTSGNVLDLAVPPGTNRTDQRLELVVEPNVGLAVVHVTE
jgi:hypothetical protein